MEEVVPAVTLPLKPGDLALRLTGGVGSGRRVHLRAGEHEVVSSTVPEEGSAVDASFRSFITDVIREGFDAHHLEFEGFRAGLACLELRRPTSGLSNSSGHSGLTGPC